MPLSEHLRESIEPQVVEHFNELATKWINQTRYLSNDWQSAQNPNCEEIRKLGSEIAVPLILHRWENEHNRWFIVLYQLTGEDPATGETYYDEARKAWLKWGEEKGLLENVNYDILNYDSTN